MRVRAAKKTRALDLRSLLLQHRECARRPASSEALKMYNKALRTRITVLGPKHLEPAKTKVHMGIVYNKMGAYEKALELYT